MSAKATNPRSGASPGPGSTGDLSEPVARLMREQLESVDNELRAEFRARLGARALKLNTGAGVLALYAGAALAVAIGLLLATVMPGWAAALVVTALLAAGALALRNAARGGTRARPSTAPVPSPDGTVPHGAVPDGAVPHGPVPDVSGATESPLAEPRAAAPRPAEPSAPKPSTPPSAPERPATERSGTEPPAGGSGSAEDGPRVPPPPQGPPTPPARSGGAPASVPLPPTTPPATAGDPHETGAPTPPAAAKRRARPRPRPRSGTDTGRK